MPCRSVSSVISASHAATHDSKSHRTSSTVLEMDFSIPDDTSSLRSVGSTRSAGTPPLACHTCWALVGLLDCILLDNLLMPVHQASMCLLRIKTVTCIYAASSYLLHCWHEHDLKSCWPLQDLWVPRRILRRDPDIANRSSISEHSAGPDAGTAARLLPIANIATTDPPRTAFHAGTAGTGVTLPSSISGQARGAARGAGPGMHPGLLSTSPRGALLAGARSGSFGTGGT